MVSTRKKRQSIRRLLSQVDDFDQDNFFGNNVSDRRESATVNDGSADQDFTVGISGNNLMTNENTVNVKSLERCFNDRIDSEMSNVVDTVEDRIQNAILTAIDNIIVPKIELVVRSINAPSGRDMASTRTELNCEERVGITAPFENASENSNVLHVSNMNDETQNNIPDEVSELSVPGTRFARQSHTHNSNAGNKSARCFMFPLQILKTYIFFDAAVITFKIHASLLFEFFYNAQ